MNIAISINEKFARYGYVMLLSLFEKNKDIPVHVFVLCRSLSGEIREDYRKLAELFDDKKVTFLDVREESIPFSLPSSEKWPVEIYFRLLLPFLLQDAERILYLDTDIIINDSLKEMYELPFGEDLLWGAVDNSDGRLSEKQNRIFSELKDRDGDFHYINSGVLLMNLSGLRAYYQPSDVVDLANRFSDLLSAFDQDIINFLFYRKIRFLAGEKYNFFARLYHNSGYTKQDVVDKGVTIIHYSGAKPWSGENLLTDLEGFWWEIAKKTPYYHNFLEERLQEEIRVGFENSHEFIYARHQIDSAQNEVRRCRDREREYQSLLSESKKLIESMAK